MSNYTRNMKQTVTYWAPATRDQYGKIVYASPKQFLGRWEQHIELLANRGGEEFTSKARVFLSQAVALDGYLFLGSSSASDPTTLDDARQIQLVGQSPDLRNLSQLNMAIL